jgi:ubiquinone/menaquinone biosynthesis C-methylase UbiE
MTEPVVRAQVGEAVGIDPNAAYSLGSSVGETERLERQAGELAPESEVVISRVGLRAGDNAIDLGCGPCGVLELLHRRVFPGGRVVGLDSDPVHIEMAAGFVAGRGLDGVEVVAADARSTGLPADSFDLVHARTLLINVPGPGEVVGEMVRLAKPGGWVAGLEPEPQLSICYPPHPAFDRIGELFFAAFTRNGADPQVGRKMAELYRAAGLEDVAVETRASMYPIGHSRRTIRVDLLRAMRPQILELGLANEPELDELDATARAHLQNGDVIVMPHLNVLAWGRKPTLV